MYGFNQIRIELRCHRTFVMAVTEILLLELINGYAFVFKDLADGCIKLGVKHGKEGVVRPLFIVVFFYLCETHSYLELFVLLMHLVLNQR
jgi:hypothetical protein